MRNNSDFDLFYQTVNKEYFKAIYIETTDAVYNTLKERFEQPSFIIFSTLEQLLLKLLNGENYQKEHGDFVLVYANNVEATALPSELLILCTMFKSLKPAHFGTIVVKLKTISPKKCVVIVKIELATGATLKSPFSLGKQLKT